MSFSKKEAEEEAMPKAMPQFEAGADSFDMIQPEFEADEGAVFYDKDDEEDMEEEKSEEAEPKQEQKQQEQQIQQQQQQQQQQVLQVNKNFTQAQLVSLQEFDGSWAIAKLSSLIGISVSDLQSANSTGADDVCWATALAIALLELRFSSTKNNWRMVATKARAILQKAGVTVQVVIDSATQFLSNKV